MLTIAANFTKEVSNQEIFYGLRICGYCFVVQVSLFVFYMWDYMSLKDAQPFYLMATSLRLIAALLLHQAVFKKFQTILTVLTFLKRTTQSPTHKRGRLTNISLCILQLTIPILSMVAASILFIQESKLSMITKAYIVNEFL